MPYPDGNPFAAPTIVSERLILAKFHPVQVETFNLYVDSDTGQDQSPGNGTQAFPYKTIPRAMSDIASSSIRESSIVHLSGVATHKIPDGYLFPGIFSSDKPGASGSDFFQTQGPLTFRAEPQIILTLQAADIVAQVLDPTTGILELTVSVPLVPGALDQKAVRTGLGGFARVVTNTANRIKISIFGAQVAPIVIFDEGATIEPENPGSFFPTLCFRGVGAVVLQGVKVLQTIGIPGSSVDAAQGQSLFIEACTLDSLTLGGGFFDVGPGYCSASGLLLSSLGVTSGRFSVGSSLFPPGYQLDSPPGPSASFVATQCVFLDPNNFTVDQFSQTKAFASCELSNCEINNSQADDAVLQRGGSLVVTDCLFVGNVKDWALTVAQGAQAVITNVRFTAGNRALRVDSGSYADITGAVGAGNLAGAQINNGAQAKVDATTSILGGPELVVGSLPAQTWAAFHAVKNSFDTTAVTGQLSRCWEP